LTPTGLLMEGDFTQISIPFDSVHTGSIRLKSEDECNGELRQLILNSSPFAVGTVASKDMDLLSTFLSNPVS